MPDVLRDELLDGRPFGSAGLSSPRRSRSGHLAERRCRVDRFYRFVERVGGVAIVGKPLTLRFQRNGRSAQLFANFLLEYWPENAGESYEVQPALLGELVSGGRYFHQIAPFRSEPTVEYVWQTRHSSRLGFLRRGSASDDRPLGLPTPRKCRSRPLTASLPAGK